MMTLTDVSLLIGYIRLRNAGGNLRIRDTERHLQTRRVREVAELLMALENGEAIERDPDLISLQVMAQ